MPRSDTDPDAPALRVPHVLCASTAAARGQWPEGSMEDIKGFLMARIISNWRKCGLEGLVEMISSVHASADTDSASHRSPIRSD